MLGRTLTGYRRTVRGTPVGTTSAKDGQSPDSREPPTPSIRAPWRSAGHTGIVHSNDVTVDSTINLKSLAQPRTVPTLDD